MRSHYWIAAPHRVERDRLRAGLDLPPLLAVVDAHRQLRGPYTAAGTLIRAVAADAFRLRPELAERHYIELQESTPELTGQVPPIIRTLEKTASGPAEVSRYPARLHTLRVSHGLVDFLGAYLDALGDGPRTLVVENAHEADVTDQEFLAVLLRRLGPERLTLVVGTGPQGPQDPPGDAMISLPATLARHAARIDGPAEPLAGLHPAADPEPLAAAWIATDGTSDDPARTAAYERLDAGRRAALHDCRAAELAERQEAEPSLLLGAIPYHLEHGTDPAGAGARALRRAQDRCKYLGFYHAAVELGERGCRITDPEREPELWWGFTKAMAVCLAAAGRADESAELHDEARRLTTDPVLHMKLAYETAMLYARHYPEPRRDPKLARAWVNQAIAIAGLLEDPKERTFYSVFNRNGLALVEIRAGRPDEALALLDAGIERLERELGMGEKTWHRVGLRYNRAQVNGMSGRLEDALEDYAAVIAVDDGFADHYFNRGNILRRLGRTEEAVADYERALRLEPPFPEVYYNRGDARLDLGDPEGALADFERALELDPDHLDAQLNRAGVLADLGETEAALIGVTAGLALAPEHPQLLCLKGRLLAEQGALAAAREAVGAALRGDPDLAEGWAVSGELAYAEGDLKQALADLDRAVDLADGPAVRFNRAVVHQATGHFEQAVADYDAVLAETDDEDARQRRDSCLRAAAARAHA